MNIDPRPWFTKVSVKSLPAAIAAVDTWMKRESLPLFSAVLFITPVRLPASDAADAPLATKDAGADIGDLYFFLDPNDNNFAVAAVTVGGGISPAMNAQKGFFDAGVRFEFAFENTGDAIADYVIGVTHSAQTSRTAPQTATVVLPPHATRLPSGATFSANTTISRSAFGPQGAPTFGGGTQAQQTPVETTHGPSLVTYFGGLIDDPCFFDSAAEQPYRASRLANQTNPAILTRGRDSFAGTNTLVVVLRVPVALIKGGGNVVGLSVATQRQGEIEVEKKPKKGEPTTAWFNVDRMGHPFVNHIFTSYAIKDSYNEASPSDDAAGVFAADIVGTMQALNSDSTSIGILAGLFIVNGDILRLNVALPNTGLEGGTNAAAAYPNGRRPNDDVTDTIITLINNRVFQGDAVNDNELPMKSVFPFFAQPHMPFPPGAGSEDLTRN
jgi:hypothetical protein